MDWLLIVVEAYGAWLHDTYAAYAQDAFAGNAFVTAVHVVIGAQLLFYDYPELIPIPVAGTVWIMRDSVICFLWGRLRTDNWYLDNPYAAWIQLIQTSLESDRRLHKQSVLANSPAGSRRHRQELLARQGTRRQGKRMKQIMPEWDDFK